MLVIPSVDIKGGKCVQLVGGRPETKRAYGDPVEAALRWVAEGAEYLHLVDLDAAMETGDNFIRVVEVLANVQVGVQVGGGIRTLDRALELLGMGADRVILGTLAFEKPEEVKKLVKLAGGARVMVAIDAARGKVLIKGWRASTDKHVLEAAREFEGLGVGALLFTNVDVEGRMTGVSAGAIQEIVRSVNIPVFVAGGVASIEDVRRAKEAGAAGLVIGKALYERRLTLKQAMEAAR